MERKKIQALFQQTDDILVGALCDDIELCQQIDYPVYGRYFYPPHFWNRVEKIKEGVIFRFLGLNNSCEKKMIAICPPEYGEEFLDFPVKYFKIISGSKFKELEHKHFLGTIMSLGVKREMLGDLVVRDGVCYGIINEELFDFLKENLNTVGKTPVTVVEIPPEEIPESEFQDIVESVASMRLDLLVSTLGNLSRNGGIELLETGDVQLNYNIEKDKSKIINVGDIISIRKKGKFLVDSILGESKKGKTRVLIKKFS